MPTLWREIARLWEAWESWANVQDRYSEAEGFGSGIEFPFVPLGLLESSIPFW